MPHRTVDIRANDGVCPTHIFTSAGTGPWPGVVLFMDGLGVRPALFEIGERLATSGYYVILPDLYYRSGFTQGPKVFKDPQVRAEWTKSVLPTVTAAKIMSDVPALLEQLDSQPGVRRGKIGATGYCLGGRLSLAAAGHFPDRIAAAASYRASNLATALTEAHVDHVVETYNARHGFVPSDTPVHDEAATRRHWDTLLPLFEQTLKSSTSPA